MKMIAFGFGAEVDLDGFSISKTQEIFFLHLVMFIAAPVYIDVRAAVGNIFCLKYTKKYNITAMIKFIYSKYFCVNIFLNYKTGLSGIWYQSDSNFLSICYSLLIND
jgi:hypothetical protein